MIALFFMHAIPLVFIAQGIAVHPSSLAMLVSTPLLSHGTGWYCCMDRQVRDLNIQNNRIIIYESIK